MACTRYGVRLPASPPPFFMRLNAFLARAGVASRRGADRLILEGRVQVNGKPGQLNDDISENDTVELDGKQVKKQSLRYILLYKPDRMVSTLDDPQNRPKVIDLIDIPERVVPVGRLDFDTTGVLLLTNDGELTNKLMHPSFEVDKVYEAEVKGQITNNKLKRLEQGIKLEDGLTAPAKAHILPSQGLSLRDEQRLEIIIHEGRNHQVKRMLEAVGLTTHRLHRSKYGPLDLNGLKPSQWRELSKEEVLQLQEV